MHVKIPFKLIGQKKHDFRYFRSEKNFSNKEADEQKKTGDFSD